MTELPHMLKRAGSVLAVAALAAFASNAEDIDFTDCIANPSFESGFSGWTQSGMQTQTNTTFPLKAGNTYVERWVSKENGAGNCSVTQVVTGLIPGGYTLTASAQNIRQGNDDPQTGVVVFAGDKTADVTIVADYTVDFTVGVDGTVEIGYRATDASGNYLATDNFRLTYTRYNAADVNTFVGNICDEAETLLASKMDRGSSEALANAVSAVRNAAAQGAANAIAGSIKTLRTAMADAQTSISAYATLATAIDEITAAYDEIKGQPGSEEIETLLKQAEQTYLDATATPAEVDELVRKLNNAILLYRISQSTAQAPTVTTHPYVARGATFALGRSTIELPEGARQLEAGFCWSTDPEPTVADFRSSKAFNHNGHIYHLTGMEPSTIYYVRAYAITTDYAVGYGDAVKVITIPKGTITWTYNPDGAPADASERILAATEGAVNYWNQCTSISGYHITVNYNAGVPTADCSYGGWIRMGANASYQAIGTLMHEMNHGVGVGQHTVWYGPDSPYRETGESGLWYGVRATELIRFLQNDETAMLHGDKTHMWPYGINGAHEDDHTEILYLANGLVTQAVGEDALPPVAGRFHTPAYTFPIDENIRYYLKVEDPESGAYSNYLVETDGNKIGWETLTASDATTDGHAAWYMAFDPVNCYYTLCNAATGNFLAMAKGARRAVVSAPEESEAHLMRFQLTPSINKVTVGDRSELTYWVTVAEAVDTPRALSINSNGEPAYIGYSMNAGSVARQRWHIVTEADLPAFEGEAGIAVVGQDSKSIFPADVYDICGRIVKHDALNLEGLTPGIYIVGGHKFLVR